MLRKHLLKIVYMALALSACKTTHGSGVQDAAANSALYCKFAATSGARETFQLWATAGTGQLSNVGYDHVAAAANAATAPTATLGDLTPVSGSVITANGQRKVRSLYKNVLAVDFNQYTCYQLEGQATATVTFFCLANAAKAPSQRIGMIATNRTTTLYAHDLTAFATNCTLQ